MLRTNKLKVLLTTILLTNLPNFAQQSVVSCGGTAQGTEGSVTYSIGQVNYIFNSGSDGYLSQGVQQPIEIYLLTTNEIEGNFIDLQLYPNPFTSSLNLNFNTKEFQNVKFKIFNINGGLVKENNITNEQSQIFLEQLSSGTYFLQVTKDNKVIKIFKIIKK